MQSINSYSKRMDSNKLKNMQEIIDTSGFYKQTDNEWLYAKFEVIAPTYTITRKGYEEIGIAENKEGWVWYDEAPQEYLDWIESIKPPSIDNLTKN